MRTFLVLGMALLFALVLPNGAAQRSAQALGSTFVVNSTGGVGDSYLDDGICDTENDPRTDPPTPPSGICTLAAAAEQASVLPGHHTIRFAVGEVTGGGSFGGEMSGITIDGGDGAPIIINAFLGQMSALQFSGLDTFQVRNVWIKGPDPEWNVGIFSASSIPISGCVIENSFITGFHLGIWIGNPEQQVAGCRIENNRIGIDPNGNAAGNGTAILLQGGDGYQVLNNVISDTLTLSAISIHSNEALIQGNKIGTDPTGTLAIGNRGVAINIQGNNNVIMDNVISATRAETPLTEVAEGPNGYGVLIIGDDNELQDNRIGTDITGTADLGNQSGGVLLWGNNNKIMDNIISANGEHGIAIFGGESESGFWGRNNTLSSNIIGTDISGQNPLGNMGDGVLVWGGGWNDIRQNTIVANEGHGVHIKHAHDNIIGGELSDDRNLISGNELAGVHIEGFYATKNVVQGNYIGTDVTGTVALGNGGDGVSIQDAPGNIIGGPTGTTEEAECTGSCNVISGNDSDGVEITGSDATGNKVQGNFIGTDRTRTVDLGNTGHGLFINGPADNTVGGSAPGPRNYFAFNKGDGIFVDASGGEANLIIKGNHFDNIVQYGIRALLNTDGIYTIGGPDLAEGNVFYGGMAVGASLTLGEDLNVILNYQRNTHTENQIGLEVEESASGNIDWNKEFNLYEGNGIGFKASIKAAGNKNFRDDEYDGNITAGAQLDIDIAEGTHINLALEGGAYTGKGAEVTTRGLGTVNLSVQKATFGNIAGTDVGLFLDLGANGTLTVGGDNAEDGVTFDGEMAVGTKLLLGENINLGLNYRNNVHTGNKMGLEAEEGLNATINWQVSKSVFQNGGAGARFNFTGEGSYDFLENRFEGNAQGGAEFFANLASGVTMGLNVNGDVYTLNNGDNAAVKLEGDGTLNATYSNTIFSQSLGGNGLLLEIGAEVGVEANLRATLDDVTSNYSAKAGVRAQITGDYGTGVIEGNLTADENGTEGAVMVNFGFTFSHGVVSSFTGNGTAGLLVDGGEGTLEGDNISNNGIGVLVRNNGKAEITSNDIFNNIDAGVVVQENSSTVIMGNTISFNQGPGIWVESPLGSLILGNSIFSNTGLAIDLGALGRTPNDPGDADSGADNVQNFPVITAAQLDANGDLFVEYYVDSTPENSAYPLTVEFFEADSYDGGQGMTFLGSLTFTTTDFSNGSAVGNLENVSILGVELGDPVVGTAIDGNDHTSEFSESTSVSAFITLEGDVNGDGTVDLIDLVIAVSAFGSSPEDLNWNETADLNNDRTINIFDLVMVGFNFR